MDKIAVLTSGGDAPGMNAAIYGLVKEANSHGIQISGFLEGYKGLINNHSQVLDLSMVKKYLNRGGTLLGSSRTENMKNNDVQKNIVKNLIDSNIDALVVIGGDGSFQGAHALSLHGFPVIAIPATIDNDIPATELSIGFRTALHNVVNTVDIIMDSANSHQHIYGIEVMGRRAMDIAIWAGLALDAEGIINSRDITIEEIINKLDESKSLGHRSQLFFIAEGIMSCFEFQEWVENNSDYKIHPLVLGHIQRGGTPIYDDRILGMAMGKYALELLIRGIDDVNLAVEQQHIIYRNLSDTISYDKTNVYPLNLNKENYFDSL